MSKYFMIGDLYLLQMFYVRAFVPRPFKGFFFSDEAGAKGRKISSRLQWCSPVSFPGPAISRVLVAHPRLVVLSGYFGLQFPQTHIT